MKSTLTLVRSSFLFIDNVNLVRGVPKEVDVDYLTEDTINRLNDYIESKFVTSSNGYLHRSAKADVQLEGTAIIAEENIAPVDTDPVQVDITPAQPKGKRRNPSPRK